MDKAAKGSQAVDEYNPNHVMEPGPYSDRKKLTGTWKDYISVTKVGIINANLMTMIAGMWLAAGGGRAFFALEFTHILFTVLGVTFIIASGTCYNNYYDRDIDQKMDRTKDRALAEGRLDPKQILWMGSILAILGTISLLFVNVLTTFIALLGLFGYAVVYTMWFKRRHHLNTLVGSFSGAVPPMIGWVAVTGSVDPGAWILFMILFIWQPPHFFALAMRRCEDYRAAGIPMLPVVRGFEVTKKHIILYVAALIPASIALVLFTDVVGLPYLILALVLGTSWLGLTLWGLWIEKKDDIKWARINFVASLIYLTLLSIGMMVTTF